MVSQSSLQVHGSQSTVSSVRSSQTIVPPVRRNRQMNLIYQVWFIETIVPPFCDYSAQLQTESIFGKAFNSIFFIYLRLHFFQAVFQGAGIFLELITYYILQGIARNKWELFLMTSVVWCTAHAMDGWVVIFGFCFELHTLRSCCHFDFSIRFFFTAIAVYYTPFEKKQTKLRVFLSNQMINRFIVIVCNREFRRYAKKIFLCRWSTWWYFRKAVRLGIACCSSWFLLTHHFLNDLWFTVNELWVRTERCPDGTSSANAYRFIIIVCKCEFRWYARRSY